MRHLVLFLFLTLLGLVGGYFLSHQEEIAAIFAPSFKIEKEALQFAPSSYPSEKLPFCIVIVGRNNGAHLEKTIRSAIEQDYNNFRIVYVDDASDDGSFELAKEKCEGHASILKNENPVGEFASLERAVQNCRDEEIIVVLKGVDWLAHRWVLDRLNQYYSDPDLWLTCGQSRDYPAYQRNLAHPNTFYARLFKKIYREQDPTADYIHPMMEIAQGHIQHLPDVLYILNHESMK